MVATSTAGAQGFWSMALHPACGTARAETGASPLTRTIGTSRVAGSRRKCATEGQAVHGGHPEIGDHDVRRADASLREPRPPVVGKDDVQARERQMAREQFANRGGIVDDEHVGRLRFSHALQRVTCTGCRLCTIEQPQDRTRLFRRCEALTPRPARLLQ